MSRPERHWWPLMRSSTVPRAAAPAVASTRPSPIDPLTGPAVALAGRVVTMDDAFTVLADAIVYVDKGRIVAVQARGQPSPAGFETVRVVETRGTLFPGLIDLHNHLSYNALPLDAGPGAPGALRQGGEAACGERDEDRR
jgi:5-methylthioadenosine/S-adenosylhomocysteine deaminase